MTEKYNRNQLRSYPVKTQAVLKLQHDDPRVDEIIAANEPLIIQGSDLVASSSVWDLDYLSTHMDGEYTVVFSKNHKFKYYDEKKMEDFKGDFKPSTKREKMKVSEFRQKLENWKKGKDRMYLQQVLDKSVGNKVVQDFLKFNWKWITEKQNKNNWGQLTSNLMLVAMEGNVTPCHYDEQQNFYAQVKGYKRMILFRPSQFGSLYPHPVSHPYDRQSQVDFEHPDYERFPKFKDICGFEAIVEPGDILYIPTYWFHHVESLLKGGYTISINFWYKPGPIGQVEYPLKDHQKVAIMRNVEKMLKEALQDPDEIGPLLKTIIDGRYDC